GALRRLPRDPDSILDSQKTDCNEASSLQSCFAPPGRQGANRVGSRQRDAHPAQVDRETEADLSSAKAQHDPAGVAELRDAPASRHRQAGPDGRVEAHDVAWLMKVRRRSDQIRRRSADQGARAYPADRQWIIASFESQYSAAAGDAEDETGAGDVQGDRSCRG